MTYCSLRSSNSKIKLQCFTDTLERKGSPSGGFSTISKNISAENAPVYLDTITFEGSNTVSLAVVLQNGEVSLFSEDLSDTTSISGLEERQREVKYATTLSIKQAKKGLLKKRPDLLAPFEASTNVSSRLLVFIERPLHDGNPDSTALRTSIFSFQHRTTPGMDNKASSPSLVGTFDIKTPRTLPNTLNYTLHHSGQLYIWHRQRVALYHLDGTPLLEAQPIHDFPEKIKSMLRLSSNLIALVDDSSVKIVDFQHQALNASYALPATALVNGDPMADTQPKDSQRLLSFFPTLGSLVLLRERSLFLLSLADASTEDTVQHRRTTLADAIGRGLHLNHGNTRQPIQFIDGLGAAVQGNIITKQEVISKIDSSATSEDREETFDVEFASHLPDICGRPRHAEDPFEEMTVSLSQIAQHSHLVSFVISKIFALKPDSNSTGLRKRLEIQFIPPKTFYWLIQHNIVTLHRVQLALKQIGVLSATEELHQCAVVEALATFNYSLEKLLSLLAGPTPLTTREVACATRFALDVLQQSQNLSNLKLITSTEMDVDSGPDDDHEMNGDSTLEPEKDADNIHDAQSTMKFCLARLGICNDSDVRAALAQELSALHLLSLVDFLRAELAGGGWFSHHNDDAGPNEDSCQDDGHISLMIKILNCAIDALGAGAWLNTASSDEYAEKIAWMKAETSAALEGIEEATYLRGLLHEALLFVKRAPSRATTKKAPILKDSGVGVSRPIKISKDDSVDDALPLGLQPRDRVESKVLKDGKEVTRSRREMAHLKSKLVGAYSVERIMI